MGLSEYLPIAAAGCCAAVVAYYALSQAAAAEHEEREHGSSPSSSSTAPDTKHEKDTVTSRASANGHDARLDQHAAASAAGSSTKGSSTKGSSSSGASPSVCDHCHKAPERQEHLLRCSRCHHAYYCSKQCQKAAWPQHKRSCNNNCSSGSSTSPRGSASRGVSSDGGSSSSNAGNDGSSDKQAGSVLDALREVLQQHSRVPGHDPLQQQFEQAVLLFVSGEHRGAATALTATQAAAEAQGKTAIAGDCCKWLGHSHLKLGETGKAANSFAKGIELAVKCGNKRLQVDCLSGLGAMHRDLGQVVPAKGFLNEALQLAGELGDGGLRASVLTLLGTVLMGSEGAAAIQHLEEAVELREDQVITLHSSGQRGSALASAIMEHAGSLVSLASAYYVEKRYSDAADAYEKSLAIFSMVEDVEKQCKCLINLANLHEVQLDAPDSRQTAARVRTQLYRLTAVHLRRDAPETCAICCEPLNALKATEGDEQQLLLLGCAHCFHYKCWEGWSETQSATCPSCKQPSSEVPPPQSHTQAVS